MAQLAFFIITRATREVHAFQEQNSKVGMAMMIQGVILIYH
jgi:hypothetical protein